MEKVSWKVEGMSCTNCALTIDKYLQGKGLQQVKVNFMGGDLSFEMEAGQAKQEIAKGIEGLGYHVITGEETDTKKDNRIFKNHFHYIRFCYFWS